MGDKTINTTTSLLEVQCPVCGGTEAQYLDDLEWDLEQYKCKTCGQVFNVRWERQIQVIGYEDAEGAQHDVWNSDMVVGCQSQAMYYFCHGLWKHYGDNHPPGVEKSTWDLLCAAMRAIEDELPKAEHEFTPAQAGQGKPQEK